VNCGSRVARTTIPVKTFVIARAAAIRGSRGKRSYPQPSSIEDFRCWQPIASYMRAGDPARLGRARKATTAAISMPDRSVRRVMPFGKTPGRLRERVHHSGLVAPGITVLTVTPLRPSSFAQLSWKLFNATLVAE